MNWEDWRNQVAGAFAELERLEKQRNSALEVAKSVVNSRPKQETESAPQDASFDGGLRREYSEWEQAADAVVGMGRLALQFGRVDRITYHDDGVTPESDTDHTVMLGLIACSFAARYLPYLDVGLVAKYALVHDVVEVYAGDTPTLRPLSPDEAATKRDREDESLRNIEDKFCFDLPWLANTIRAYERLDTQEARYVKAMDKLLPKVTHLLNKGETLHEEGVSYGELVSRYADQLLQMKAYADFPSLYKLRLELVKRVYAIVLRREMHRG